MGYKHERSFNYLRNSSLILYRGKNCFQSFVSIRESAIPSFRRVTILRHILLLFVDWCEVIIDFWNKTSILLQIFGIKIVCCMPCDSIRVAVSLPKIEREKPDKDRRREYTRPKSTCLHESEKNSPKYDARPYMNSESTWTVRRELCHNGIVHRKCPREWMRNCVLMNISRRVKTKNRPAKQQLCSSEQEVRLSHHVAQNKGKMLKLRGHDNNKKQKEPQVS